MAITDQIEGRIQARVGHFLTLKSEILKLKTSSDPDVKAEADQLFEDQIKAEAQLKEALAAIEELKTSGFSVSAFSIAASGAVAVERQIKAVKELSKRGAGSTANTGTTSYLRYALIGVGVWWLYKKIF